MRRSLSLALPLVGFALFVFIVWRTGPQRIAQTFGMIDPAKLLILPAVIAFIILMRGYRWRYLMKMVGIDYGLGRSASVWAIGFFAAAVTPGKVGDAVRALYVSRDTGRNLGETFLTVFIDRLLDLVVVLLFGMVTTLIFSFYYIEIPSIWVVFVAMAGILGVLFILLRRDLVKRIMRPVFHAVVPNRYRDSLSMNFNSFYDSLSEYVRQWRKTAYAFGLTVVYWVMIFFLAFYVAYVMDIEVGLGYLFIVMPLVTLVELVPISVSGIGTREAAVIFFFSLVGISQVRAVGFSIAYLLMGTYVTSLVGFFFWLKNPADISLRQSG